LSEVIIHDDENFERGLKRFKKKCEKVRHFVGPSETSALREAK